MILRRLPNNERLLELLADDAIHGLDLHERRELREHLADDPDLGDQDFECSMLDIAAAQVSLAHAAADLAPLPARLRDRLIRDADLFCERQPQVAGRIEPTRSLAPVTAASIGTVPASDTDPGSDRDRRVGRFAALGWMAAAACLTLAAIGWFRNPASSDSSTSPPNSLAAELARNLAGYERFKAEVADVRRADWTDWESPEIPGVTGEIVWSDSLQTGYMRFRGLPENNGFAEQYQLWIVDERGLTDESGQSMRISGGVFDAICTGELIVPITPALKVQGAKLFALTIEKPGGTWVSDMKRRVAIAKLGA
jgi:Anti-sigma-K factor rskA